MPLLLSWSVHTAYIDHMAPNRSENVGFTSDLKLLNRGYCNNIVKPIKCADHVRCLIQSCNR